MNQINLDSLATVQPQTAQTLATLVQRQTYQALLELVGSQQGSLTLQTNTGPLQLQSSSLHLPQMQGSVAVQFTQTPSGQLQLELHQEALSPQPMQLSPSQWQQLIKSLSVALPQVSLQLPVQVQRQNQDLLLQLPQQVQPLRVALPSTLEALPSSTWLAGQVSYQKNELHLQIQAPLASRPIDAPLQSFRQGITIPLTEALQARLGRTVQEGSALIQRQGRELHLSIDSNQPPLRLALPKVLTNLPEQTSLEGKWTIQNHTLRLHLLEPALKKLASLEVAQNKTALFKSTPLPLTPTLQAQLTPALTKAINPQLAQTALPLLTLQQLSLPSALKQQLAAPAYELQLSSQGQIQLSAPKISQTVLLDMPSKGVQFQAPPSHMTPLSRPSAATLPVAALLQAATEPAQNTPPPLRGRSGNLKLV